MARPDKRQDKTYHRISDRQGSNSFTGGKRSTPEEILAYATRVLNRELKWKAMEGNERWKREKEKHLPLNRRKSSCTTCSRKQLAELAETEEKAQEYAEKKKNKRIKDEKPPKLYTHTWDVCIAVATKTKKPSLRQLLSRYFKTNMIFF